MFVIPWGFRVNATRVSWDFICLFKYSIPALWSFSPSYAVLGFQNVFCLPTSPSATRPTFPLSVLRPSFFAKSCLPYLNSAKAVKMVYYTKLWLARRDAIWSKVSVRTKLQQQQTEQEPVTFFSYVRCS